MQPSAANFVWYDLMTTDMDAAASFYKDVIGWDTKDSGAVESSYLIFSMGAARIAGLMPVPGQAGMPPAWMGYLATPDVDAATQRVAAAGGSVHVQPRDIPHVGRFSLVADPQGAAFYLFQLSRQGEGSDGNPSVPGRVCWHELCTTDASSAFAFYAEQFGWARGGTHDMGPMGPYEMISMGGPLLGGMMKMPDGMPAPCWAYYFSVDAVSEAVERVTKAGGRLLNGPMQVPGGGWIAHCTDPQGAFFGVAAMGG